MNRIERITRDERVQAALAGLRTEVDAIVELAIAVQQIPAPTFAETQRATFIQERLASLGLADVHQDNLHNVYGRYPASSTAAAPPIVVSAHSDTVFPARTNLAVRRDGHLIYGPGIGDNATGVAGLITLARTLPDFDLRLPADVWFVANVREEGLGNLEGMQAVVSRFGPEPTYIVVEGGLYGQISHQAIGARRFQITVNAPGGHSWGSFGNKSAVHELGHLIAAIDRLDVPEKPKTTYNIGVIEGGTSVNSIAQSASLLLDLRSEEPAALATLVQSVENMVAEANGRHQSNGNTGVEVTMSLIGNRPAGQIPRHTPLVKWAEAALRYVGCEQVTYIASSTDANVPLSQGLAAVCIGLAGSDNAHRLEEYMDPTHLPRGLAQLLLLTLAAANF